MSAEDLEKYETEMELTLYKEYRDIVSQFSYVVETERRFYLANSVDVAARNADGEVYFEVRMSDAWVWDMYRPARFVKNVRVVTFKDVNVEELEKPELELPDEPGDAAAEDTQRDQRRCGAHLDARAQHVAGDAAEPGGIELYVAQGAGVDEVAERTASPVKNLLQTVARVAMFLFPSGWQVNRQPQAPGEESACG
jgi:hypothetical protein